MAQKTGLTSTSATSSTAPPVNPTFLPSRGGITMCSVRSTPPETSCLSWPRSRASTCPVSWSPSSRPQSQTTLVWLRTDWLWPGTPLESNQMEQPTGCFQMRGVFHLDDCLSCYLLFDPAINSPRLGLPLLQRPPLLLENCMDKTSILWRLTDWKM